MSETKELEVLGTIFRPGEAHEWTKWGDVLPEELSIQTLCDVRRHVEGIFGENTFSSLEILEAIRDANGRVTQRPESDTADLCLVNLGKVEKILETKKSQNI